MSEHPDFAAPFHRWMSQQSVQHNAAVVAAYDFSPFRVVADIGGGQGSTLAVILHANPSLRGILFDLPQVVADPAPLDQPGIAPRCEIIGGDMRRAVPHSADAYLVKRILMSFGDEQPPRSCATARPARPPTARSWPSRWSCPRATSQAQRRPSTC
jgi:hypothetical protein